MTVTALEQEIKSRGYWWIVIHPAKYEKNRLEHATLPAMVERSRVQLRGWDFPHVGPKEPLKWDAKSVTCYTDWRYYREIWRMYRSGQFTYLLGIHEDWVDKADHNWGPPRAFAERGPLLGSGDALFRITEVFEFASRLAVTPAGDDPMVISLELHSLKDRMLWADSPRRLPMESEYRSDQDVLRLQDQFSASDLAGRSREFAVEWAGILFRTFGWDPPMRVLIDEQGELRKG